MYHRILLLCVLAAVAVAAPQVHGQDKGERAARGHFQRAEKSFNLGKFEEALTAYEAAYEAKPLPGFLFNMAQCQRNLGNAERAVFFYERFLALDPGTKNRALVEELLAEQRQKLEAARASVAGPPPPAPAAAREPAPPALGPSPARPARAPEPAATPAFVQRSAPRSSKPAPVYQRWWFWAGAAAVVGGGVAAALLIKRDPGPPQGALDPIDLR